MQNIKRILKRASAFAVGMGFLGATMAGAMAATLGDYPSPFVSSGKWQNVEYVVGVNAASADNIAATNIVSALQAAVSSGTTTTTGSTAGQVSANVPINLGVGNTSSAGFDFEVKQSSLNTLRKDTLTFQSDTYNTHDELILGRTTPGISTALTKGQKDFKTDVTMTLENTNAIKYAYVFDTSINVTKASTTDPLRVTFLGKDIEITGSSATNSITATVGDTHFLLVGDTVTVEGHTVKLENVGSSSCVVSVDGGTSTTITTGTTKSIADIQIKCDSTVSRNALAESGATVIVGKTATKTYTDGDAYVGEDKVNPKWVWAIANLATKGSTSVLTNTTNPTIGNGGPEIATKSWYTKQTPTDSPAKVGTCYDLPNNYISVCMDGLTVADANYADYKFEYLSSTDLSRAGMVLNGGAEMTAVRTIHITGPTEGFELVAPTNANGSIGGKKSTELWLFRPTQGTSSSTNNTWFFFKDTEGYTQYGGNFSGPQGSVVNFAKINYGSTKGDDIHLDILANGTSGPLNGIHLVVAPLAGLSSSTFPIANTNDNLTINWTLSSQQFNALGPTATTEEAAELTWGRTPTNIGSWDQDVRSIYGMIVKNPKSNGAADRVMLSIPEEQVQARVVIKGQGVSQVTSGTGTSAPTGKLDSELTNKEDFNLVVVGGPCINTVAAEFLGKTYPACGTASGISENTAVVQLVSNGATKMALVAAGWEADDTRRAGLVLQNYGSFKTQFGTKSSVTVTGTGLTVSGLNVA